MRGGWRALIVSVAVLVGPQSAAAHPAKADARLAKIGSAPEFALTAADGTRRTLAELRGRVVALTFIYASCADTCPLLTAKLVGIQKRLGDRAPVRFVAITVDPERDTADALRHYAAVHGARGPAWAFLTGRPEQIRAVAHRYGVYVKRHPGGDVDHTFLTSVIDADGVLRVQYLGVRFDPDELLRDVRGLLREARR